MEQIPLGTDLAHYMALVDELRMAAARGNSCGAIFGYLDATWELLTPAEKAYRIGTLR